MDYNDLKNRIEQQVIYSKNKEALSLINASIPHLNGIQKTEVEVIKMKILNELTRWSYARNSISLSLKLPFSTSLFMVLSIFFLSLAILRMFLSSL